MSAMSCVVLPKLGMLIKTYMRTKARLCICYANERVRKKRKREPRGTQMEKMILTSTPRQLPKKPMFNLTKQPTRWMRTVRYGKRRTASRQKRARVEKQSTTDEEGRQPWE